MVCPAVVSSCHGTGDAHILVIPGSVDDIVEQVPVSLVGTTILPKWLEYNPKTRTIQGLPISNDAGGYNIKVTALENILHKSGQVSTTFQLLVLNDDRNPNEWSTTTDQRFPIPHNFYLDGCTTDGPIVYTSVILQAKVDSFGASSRISLILSMAEYLRADPLLLTLCPFRDVTNLKRKKIHILASETGNRNTTGREAAEIYWPISCGSFGMLQELIQVLNHNVFSGHISQYLGWHLSGWRIFRKGEEKIVYLQRNRRQVLMVSPTPAMTPPKPTYLIRPGPTVLAQIFTKMFMSTRDYSKLDSATEGDRSHVQTRLPAIPPSNSIPTAPERQQSFPFTTPFSSVPLQAPAQFTEIAFGFVLSVSPPTSLATKSLLATTKHLPTFTLPSKPVMSLDSQTSHVLFAESVMEPMSPSFYVLEPSSYFLLGTPSLRIAQLLPTLIVVTEFETKGIQSIIPTDLISSTLSSSMAIIQPRLTEQFTATSGPNTLSTSMSSLFDEPTLLTALNMFSTPSLDKIAPTASAIITSTNQDHKAETSSVKALHSYSMMAHSEYLLPSPVLYSQSSVISPKQTSLLHTPPIHSSIFVDTKTTLVVNSMVSDDHVLRSLLFLSSTYASTLQITKSQADINDAFMSFSTIHLNTSLHEMYTATEVSPDLINSTVDDKRDSSESNTKIETSLNLVSPLHLLSEHIQPDSDVSLLPNSLMPTSRLTNVEESLSTGMLITYASSSMKITTEDLSFHSVDSILWSTELASTEVESLFYATQQIDISPSQPFAFTNISDIQTTLIANGRSEEITSTNYLFAPSIFTISPSTPIHLQGSSEPIPAHTTKPELMTTSMSLLSSDRKLLEFTLYSAKSGTMASPQPQSFSYHNEVILSSFNTQTASFLTATYITHQLIPTSILFYSFETLSSLSIGEIVKESIIKQAHIPSVSFQERPALSTHSLSLQENQSSWDLITPLNSSIDGLVLLQHSSLTSVDCTPYSHSVTKLILSTPASVASYPSVGKDLRLSTFPFSPTSPSPEFSFLSTAQDPLTSLQSFRQITNQSSQDNSISFPPSFIDILSSINFTETLSSSVPSNELKTSFGVFEEYSDNITMPITTSVAHYSLPSLMPSFSSEVDSRYPTSQPLFSHYIVPTELSYFISSLPQTKPLPESLLHSFGLDLFYSIISSTNTHQISQYSTNSMSVSTMGVWQDIYNHTELFQVYSMSNISIPSQSILPTVSFDKSLVFTHWLSQTITMPVHSVQETQAIESWTAQDTFTKIPISSETTIIESLSPKQTSKMISSTLEVPASEYNGQANKSPTVVNPIEFILTTVGQRFHYSIPADTFFDEEDGDARNLTLTVASIDGSPSGRESWVRFNQSRSTLFGYPLETDYQYSPQEFVLTATDSGGLIVQEGFVIELRLSHDTPCHLYMVRTKNSYHSFLQDRGRVLYFLEKLAKYLNDSSSEDIVLFSIKPGSTLLTWYNNSLCSAGKGLLKECPVSTIQRLLKLIRLPDGLAHPSFVEAMLPEYRILTVENVTYGGACLPLMPTAGLNTTIIHPRSSYLLTTVWPAILTVLLLILLVALLVTIYCFCRYSEKILPSEELSFQENRPTARGQHFEMDALRPRKPPMFIHQAPPPSQLWARLPSPPPYQQVHSTHSDMQHDTPPRIRGLKLQSEPPRYQLPPPYELQSKKQPLSQKMHMNKI
uniref:mucin-3A-like n=1 Tax=Pristiophorus japonicus TaxID=55135 RepID=UPI00398E7CF0